MPRQFPAWCQDCREIARLLRYLDEYEGLDVQDCIEVVSKPWNWDAEYQEMVRVQSRDQVEFDDLFVGAR